LWIPADRKRVGMSKGSGIQAVEFALRILEYVAHCQTSVGVSELARAFDTTKSRIHRHLQTLVSAGYLIRNEDTERYSVSARLVALGQAVSESFGLATAARDVARSLRDNLGHAVAISQPEPDGNRILLLMPSRSNIDISVKPGSLLPYNSSAQGKVCLAFGDPVKLQEVCSQTLIERTPHTITDPDRLRAEVDQVRRRRWAVAPNEAMIGLNALAAPIFDALGAYVGSVAITDSVQFIPEEPTREQIDRVLEAAEKVSANLGYREPVRHIAGSEGRA
jgi:IclR family transcriptional regulator, KDG regulon repressor